MYPSTQPSTIDLDQTLAEQEAGNSELQPLTAQEMETAEHLDRLVRLENQTPETLDYLTDVVAGLVEYARCHRLEAVRSNWDLDELHSILGSLRLARSMLEQSEVSKANRQAA